MGLCAHNTAQSQTTTAAAAPQRAPSGASIDSFAPESTFPARGVGLGGGSASLRPQRGVEEGMVRHNWVNGFGLVQAGLGRPNREEWCQGRAGTSTWRQETAEMGGGVGVWRGWVSPHPSFAASASVDGMAWWEGGDGGLEVKEVRGRPTMRTARGPVAFPAVLAGARRPTGGSGVQEGGGRGHRVRKCQFVGPPKPHPSTPHTPDEAGPLRGLSQL